MTIGSSKLEAVCLGEQLRVKCSTNGSTLSWKLLVPHSSEATTKLIFATDPDNATDLKVLGGIPFQFSKTLNLSLMSAVVVNGANVTSDLNGTMLNCTCETEELMTTTVLLIGNGIILIYMYMIMVSIWGISNYQF